MYYPQACDKLQGADKLSHRLFYLQGDDPYFVEDILKTIYSFYSPGQVLESGPVEKEIITKIKQTSFLDDEYCVVARNINKLDGYMALMERLKKKDYPNRLVLISPEPPKLTQDSIADVFFKELRKRAFYVDCMGISIFNSVRLESMVKYFFRRGGSNIDDAAATLFVANTDMSNLRAVNHEAYRLSTMFLGETITPSMLVTVLSRSPKLRLFALVKHIAVKDLGASIKLVNILMQDGCSANVIIDYLFKFFSKVILLVDYLNLNKFSTSESVAHVLELPLPVVPDYMSAAKNFNIRKLYNALQQLRIASVKVHQGVSPDFCIGSLVLKICRK